MYMYMWMKLDQQNTQTSTHCTIIHKQYVWETAEHVLIHVYTIC